MIDKTINTSNFKLWLFDFENDEWERVRSLCLEENNWLRNNYTKNRCKVSEHKLFFIAYIDNDPFLFGGIKEYTPMVARAFNRMYGFPKYRSAKKFREHQKWMSTIILPEMEHALGFEYPLTFISMQPRNKGYGGEQKWWKYWKEGWFKSASNWNEHNALVQTCDADVESCYQNIVYKLTNDYTFDKWNPNTISYDEYYRKFIDV